jgi:serine/threonine-protein kinase
VKTIKLPSGAFLYDPAKPLGKPGGFGQVFAGTTSDGKEVAVKKLHISSAKAAHRELQIADELKGRSFDHVVPFIDAGEDADSGDYFVVMTKAEHSLQEFIDKSAPIQASETASILLQIVSGLIEVGDLAHRDLKPDNVLFHDGKWKIADFGIARFIEDVTASNTLKGYLTPEYAAPEQWRLERATHAADIYALGCIAFCLLTKNPPFQNNHSDEHQRAPVPQFDCSDSRLHSLISLMLRKLPETRPSALRVKQLLNEIIAKPHIGGESNPFSILAVAGAQVAAREQQREAAEQAALERKRKRNLLAQSARGILKENLERLSVQIENNAPTVKRYSGYEFYIELGDVVLQFNLDNTGLALPEDESILSQWDVITAANVFFSQRNPEHNWSASLWYAKLKGQEEYRWHEIGYFSPLAQIPYVRAAPNIRIASDAFVRNPRVAYADNSGLVIAYGPLLVDDEAENEFHSRIGWLLAKGSNGQLGTPRRLPFTWPPQM